MKTNGKKKLKNKPDIVKVLNELKIHTMELVHCYNVGVMGRFEIRLCNKFDGIDIIITRFNITVTIDTHFYYQIFPVHLPNNIVRDVSSGKSDMDFGEASHCLITKIEDYTGQSFFDIAPDFEFFD